MVRSLEKNAFYNWTNVNPVDRPDKHAFQTDDGLPEMVNPANCSRVHGNKKEPHLKGALNLCKNFCGDHFSAQHRNGMDKKVKPARFEPATERLFLPKHILLIAYQLTD